MIDYRTPGGYIAGDRWERVWVLKKARLVRRKT